MHNKLKNVKQFLLGVCCTAIVLSQPITSFASAQPAPSQSDYLTSSMSSENGSRAAAIYYVYKEENGHLYKRLYDFTYQRWIGDWIFVR